MGIFRRRTVVTPKTQNFDLFRGDQALRSAYVQAVQGSWRHLDPFLDGRSDGWLVGELFGSDRSAIPTRVMAAWAKAAPSGRSLAFHGRVLVRDAWANRGRAYAREVDAIAWEPFAADLEEAERVLWKGVEIAPGSADPWVGLIATARGLSLGRDEVVHRFNQAHGRDQFRPDACAQAMQGLCAKWFGSDEEMFGFARWVESEAPAGSAARMLLPLAHIERLVAASGQGINAQNYFAVGRISAELCDGVERYLAATPKPARPEHLDVLNAYVYTLKPIDVRSARLVRECVERVAGRPTERPWMHEGEDIVGRYQSVSEARLLETHLYPW